MRLTPWLVLALVLFALWQLNARREVTRAPGVIALAEPLQQEIDRATKIRHGTFTLQPRAEFSATVRILRREDYSIGPLAELVPTDFAVGWGPMSDSAVLAAIDISQSNRFYFWRTETWPVPRAVIESHSANWHVIPADDKVAGVLDRLRAGDLVELRGELVDIQGRDGGMTTSLSRYDTGAGACEIIHVSSARIAPR